MGRLAMLRPYPLTVSATPANGNISRILTPDPKEAVFLAAGATTITFDIGGAAPVDTIFLGFTGSLAWDVTHSLDNVAFSGVVGQVRSDDVPTALWTPVRHGTIILPTAFSARYVRLAATVPANFPIGVAALGAKLESFWGHEWGAGRAVEDTGSSERLLGGGFGISEGARVGGYQWTFGDLTDAELRDLYAFTRDRGTTRSCLVVEDPDRTIGLHERIHWGLLDRLEPYERLQPGASRWNLRIRDWS